MSESVLRGDIRTALSHLMVLGLAAILEDAGEEGLRVGWTASLDPHPVLSSPDLDTQRCAGAVQAHAQRHTEPADWVAQGLMSPRVHAPADQQAWDFLASQRTGVIDAQSGAQGRRLDLRLIGALGEPAHWRFSQRGERRPDEGASRWEMKTRNKGEEFVRHRLRKLATHVAAREQAAILDGLVGRSTIDEAGDDEIDSRTATGLAGLGPTDNAAAWCALWGLSQFPVVHLVGARSWTTGHLKGSREGSRQGWFYVPVPSSAMVLPRIRALLVSDHLARAAAPVSITLGSADEALAVTASRRWLLDRGIGAVVRFPIGEFGSPNAPERRALGGVVLPLLEGP